MLINGEGFMQKSSEHQPGKEAAVFIPGKSCSLYGSRTRRKKILRSDHFLDDSKDKKLIIESQNQHIIPNRAIIFKINYKQLTKYIAGKITLY